MRLSSRRKTRGWRREVETGDTASRAEEMVIAESKDGGRRGSSKERGREEGVTDRKQKQWRAQEGGHGIALCNGSVDNGFLNIFPIYSNLQQSRVCDGRGASSQHLAPKLPAK